MGGGGVTLKEDYTLLRSMLGSPILGTYRVGVAATVPTSMPRHTKGYLIRLGELFWMVFDLVSLPSIPNNPYYMTPI